jgi:hypothetical protein
MIAWTRGHAAVCYGENPEVGYIEDTERGIMPSWERRMSALALAAAVLTANPAEL